MKDLLSLLLLMPFIALIIIFDSIIVAIVAAVYYLGLILCIALTIIGFIIVPIIEIPRCIYNMLKKKASQNKGW